jgi:DnaJ family protein C protein 11
LALSIFQIQLLLGPESSIAVGWQKKHEKMSASGELKVHLIAFSSKTSMPKMSSKPWEIVLCEKK